MSEKNQMAKQKDLELYILKMVINTVELWRVDIVMGMVNKPGRMVMSMREIGRKTKCTYRES